MRAPPRRAVSDVSEPCGCHPPQHQQQHRSRAAPCRQRHAGGAASLGWTAHPSPRRVAATGARSAVCAALADPSFGGGGRAAGAGGGGRSGAAARGRSPRALRSGGRALAGRAGAARRCQRLRLLQRGEQRGQVLAHLHHVVEDLRRHLRAVLNVSAGAGRPTDMHARARGPQARPCAAPSSTAPTLPAREPVCAAGEARRPSAGPGGWARPRLHVAALLKRERVLLAGLCQHLVHVLLQRRGAARAGAAAVAAAARLVALVTNVAVVTACARPAAPQAPLCNLQHPARVTLALNQISGMPLAAPRRRPHRWLTLDSAYPRRSQKRR